MPAGNCIRRGKMMNDYEVVIGLEVHAELNTESKIYCDCKNAFGLEVNTQVCPVCMGMPGALPTLNEKVVEYAIKMGHALNCKINNVCKQDRKNYFYPDLPKAYQISQSDVPLCQNGYLDVMIDGKIKRIGITRIHIEEDAGKLLHDDAFAGSLVDLNRCGVPLIEIVSEPDMRSSAEAKAYLDTIKSILQYLDISDCKMQEGSIRCDVNVSVHKKGEPFGTRCEMKNVNSFSAAVRAIDYEAKRQIELLEAGGTVEQETRRWDDAKGISITMRSKEDAQDYRYFPEPDLLTIVVDESKVRELKESLPELPNAKIARYVNDFGLPQNDAALIVDVPEKAKLFDECIKVGGCSPKIISNWILGDISKYMNETGKSISETHLSAERLAKLFSVIEKGVISNAAGKIVFEAIISEDKDPMDVIKEKNLAQNSDADYLEKLARDVLAQNEKSVTDYKNGKTNALGFLVGQCMKASQGKANPGMMKEIVLKMLSE
ncbi:MAG: aspartyl-tRNA(Asn)/glutamyl-tRNA(Gln) amidotransferase subunit [Clostridiales bacterium]|jgi:aspartyl-tRNA(Asn)/glutamyl-tRNA(Gln) amidotransferase subunit B|nr:gatB [Oscillospiraceae bacterium]MDN5378762.1 aspartyl-tRNA(Asn)/glutamyl-tRNA(Gln) amidotransferase subunit [Clostridiales bacterium]